MRRTMAFELGDETVWRVLVIALLATACGSESPSDVSAGNSGGSGATSGSGGGSAGSGGTAGGGGNGGLGGAGASGGAGGTAGSGAAGGAGGTSGAGGGGGSAAIISAIASCAPTGSACAALADGKAYASYRKDQFFADGVYNEYTDSPTAGGRFHIALTAATTGPVASVLIDGFDTAGIATANKPPVDWYHVWPGTLKQGEPFFVQFHSRDPKWDGKPTGALKVTTSTGTAFDGTFPVAKTPVPITWVTTTDDHKNLVIHLRNADSQPHTLTRLLVGQRDVTPFACIPQKTITPGASAMLTLPLCQPAKAGEAWTVVAEYQAAAAVGVGRVLPEHFPIVTWNNTSDCPFPQAKTANYDKHLAAGIDTLFLSGPKSDSGCTFDPGAVIASAAQSAKFQLMVGASTGLSTSIPDASGVAAFMTGDESDGQIYDSNGHSVAAAIAKEVDELWAKYPARPTYNGGKTNGNNGTFSGTDDVQGMDVYIGGCPPHITAWGGGTPPRMPFDYLKNTRNNHMPLPTWLYAQGLSPVSAWKTQPTPAEIWVQALSVIAAGGKGFMWFQTNMEKAQSNPASWDAMSQVGRMLQGVRPHLLEGDLTGMAKSDDKTLVDAIRSRDAIVVPVIDIATSSGPSDVSCALVSTPWTFSATAPSVSVTVPDDFTVVDVFEVTTAPAHVADFKNHQVAGRVLTLSAVALDNARPARLFVLARTPGIRASVAAGMSY